MLELLHEIDEPVSLGLVVGHQHGDFESLKTAYDKGKLEMRVGPCEIEEHFKDCTKTGTGDKGLDYVSIVEKLESKYEVAYHILVFLFGLVVLNLSRLLPSAREIAAFETNNPCQGKYPMVAKQYTLKQVEARQDD